MKKKILVCLFVAIIAMVTLVIATSAATVSSKFGTNCWIEGDEETGIVTVTAEVPGQPAIATSSVLRTWARKSTINTVIFAEGVTEIADGACDGGMMTDVSLPSTLTKIGSTAFIGCKNLKNLTIAEGTAITEIGNSAFKNCAQLLSFDLSKNTTSITIGDEVFVLNEHLTSVSIPNVTSISGDKTFSRCFRLATVSLTGTYTSIPEEAFLSCGSLVDLTLGGSVSSLGTSAFYNCSRLTSFTIPSAVTVLPNNVFKGTGLTSVVIPDAVQSIGIQAFYNCKDLKSVTFGSGVKTLNKHAFNGCGLTSVVIPGTLTTVGEDAFYGNTSLASVTINEGVTEVGAYAFCNDTALLTIEFPASLTKLGGAVCRGCTGLTNATVKSGVDILNQSFSGCSKLQTVSLNDATKRILPEAFMSCSKLVNISIPSGLTDLGNSAFRACSALTSVSIPGTVKTIGTYAFYGTSSLETLVLNEGIEVIDSYAFRGCGVTEIRIPETVTTLGAQAFRGLTHSSDIYVPASVVTYTSSPADVFQVASGTTMTIHTVADSYTAKNLTATSTRIILFDYAPDVPTVDGLVADVVVNGSTATVTLSLSNVEALTSLRFALGFDDSVLTFVSATSSMTGYTCDPADANPVRIVWVNGLENIDVNGELAVVTFEVAQDATITEESFTLSYDADDVCKLVEGIEVNVTVDTTVVVAD